MDEIDQQVIKILKENARTTYVEIGRLLKLSEGTVRNRVQALIDSGVITKFTIEVSLSVGIRALIMASIEPTIGELNGIEKIYEVTGEYEIVCVVTSANIEGLNQTIEDIRAIPGVTSTNTIIVLRTN